MNNSKGWTIIQTMVALLIAGVVAAFAVDWVIEKRCEEDGSRWICANARE